MLRAACVLCIFSAFFLCCQSSSTGQDSDNQQSSPVELEPSRILDVGSLPEGTTVIEASIQPDFMQASVLCAKEGRHMLLVGNNQVRLEGDPDDVLGTMIVADRDYSGVVTKVSSGDREDYMIESLNVEYGPYYDLKLIGTNSVGSHVFVGYAADSVEVFKLGSDPKVHQSVIDPIQLSTGLQYFVEHFPKRKASYSDRRVRSRKGQDVLVVNGKSSAKFDHVEMIATSTDGSRFIYEFRKDGWTFPIVGLISDLNSSLHPQVKEVDGRLLAQAGSWIAEADAKVICHSPNLEHLVLRSPSDSEADVYYSSGEQSQIGRDIVVELIDDAGFYLSRRTIRGESVFWRGGEAPKGVGEVPQMDCNRSSMLRDGRIVCWREAELRKRQDLELFVNGELVVSECDDLRVFVDSHRCSVLAVYSRGNSEHVWLDGVSHEIPDANFRFRSVSERGTQLLFFRSDGAGPQVEADIALSLPDGIVRLSNGSFREAGVVWNEGEDWFAPVFGGGEVRGVLNGQIIEGQEGEAGGEVLHRRLTQLVRRRDEDGGFRCQIGLGVTDLYRQILVAATFRKNDSDVVFLAVENGEGEENRVVLCQVPCSYRPSVQVECSEMKQGDVLKDQNLALTELRVTDSNGSRVHEAELLNLSGDEGHFLYRWKYFDQQGNELQYESSNVFKRVRFRDAGSGAPDSRRWFKSGVLPIGYSKAVMELRWNSEFFRGENLDKVGW